MSQQRRGGKIFFQVNGVIFDAKGNFEYNLGVEKREAIVGSDRIHGFKTTEQPPFIEGEITDRGDLDLKDFVSIVDATVTLELANGKVISLKDAWYAGEGTGNSEEGNIACRFEGISAQELQA